MNDIKLDIKEDEKLKKPLIVFNSKSGGQSHTLFHYLQQHNVLNEMYHFHQCETKITLKFFKKRINKVLLYLSFDMIKKD